MSSPTDEQTRLHIGYMEEHSFFARKQITKLGVCGVDKYRSMLKSVADMLNLHGPPFKEPEEWEKVWDGMRLEAQDQMRRYLDANRQTGEHNIQAPSEFVQRICYIFGDYGVGSNLVPEIGVYNQGVGEKTFILNEAPEEGWLDKLHDKNLLAMQNKVCNYYLLDADSMKKTSSSRFSTNSYNPLPGPSNENAKLKLSSECLKTIASFMEGVEAAGCYMTMKQWDCLAKKPSFAYLLCDGKRITGELVKSLWEVELDRVLTKRSKIMGSTSSKTKLTPTEEIVFGVVGKDCSTFLGDEKDQNNDLDDLAPEDNFLDNYEEAYDVFVTPSATSSSPARASLDSLQVLSSTSSNTATGASKNAIGKRALSPLVGCTLKKPKITATSSSPACASLDSLQMLPSTNSNTTTATSENPIGKPALSPLVGCAPKKPKVTGLQMQKEGVEAILEGNDIFGQIIDVLSEHLGVQNSIAKDIRNILERNLEQQLANHNALIQQIHIALDNGLENLSNNVRLLGDRLCSTMFSLYNTHKMHELERAGISVPKSPEENYFGDAIDDAANSEEDVTELFEQDCYKENVE